MSLGWVLVALWLGPAAVLLVALLLWSRRGESPGARALAEDIEVMSLEFTWSLPSWEEGIHAAG